MDIMRALINARVQADMVCCDPPYLLTAGGCKEHESSMQGCFAKDKYKNSGHLVACDVDWNDFMPLFFGLMERGHAYVMANNRNVHPMLAAAERAGFEFHNLLVWDKGTATPNRWYMKNCEFTGLFYKGKARRINDCGSMSCIKMPHVDESTHPTEKPVPLMEHYILNSTQPGQMVIDPFMGSGTTGVAAVRAGRKFIGIEMDEGHFKTSVRRISAALDHAQSRLF